MLVFSWVDYSPATYGDYEYPEWADAIGWVMTLAAVVPIFIIMVLVWCFIGGSCGEVGKKALNGIDRNLMLVYP